MTDLTRKEFIRLGFLRTAGGLADAILGPPDAAAERLIPPATVQPWVRPPGAVEEALFLEACTSCDDCLEACPHMVIRKAGPETGASTAGTPVVLPAENPCVMCDDLPCIAACDTGALVQREKARIGTAVVDESLCYQTAGQPCDYCQVRCPERPRAIAVGSPGSIPMVSTEGCTGCGICAQVCPAGAIAIADHRARIGAAGGARC